MKHRCQLESCNCNQSSSVYLRECHIFLLRYIKIEVIVRIEVWFVTLLPQSQPASATQNGLCRSGLHHVDRNVDVAPCSVRISACFAVRGVHNGLGDFALQARQADVKPCSEEVNVARIAQVYFGIDGCVSRKFDLHPVSDKCHRTNETGGPPSGKQLLRIGTSSWDSGSRELNIQAAIITAGDTAAPPARSMDLGGVRHLHCFLD